MNNKFEQSLDVFMEEAIQQGLEQYRQAQPDYGLLCEREDWLFGALSHFFKSGKPDAARLYYDMMKEYFELINNKLYLDRKAVYVQGYRDCARIARRFGHLLRDDTL